jgi:hypothetical protein
VYCPYLVANVPSTGVVDVSQRTRGRLIMDCMSLSLNVLGYLNIRPTLIPHLHMRIRVHSPLHMSCVVYPTPRHMAVFCSCLNTGMVVPKRAQTPYLSLSLKTHATHPRVRWEGTVVWRRTALDLHERQRGQHLTARKTSRRRSAQRTAYWAASFIL